MTFHAPCSRACAWLMGPVFGAILLMGAATLAASFALAQVPRQSAPQMQREPAAPQMQRQPASPRAQQQRAPAQGQIASADFRTALQPHGRWQQHSRWGEVWSPANRARDWRPYTVGRWAYTDDWGWYWISDAAEANWGWMTYHYGRWVFDPEFGWIWVPGREWSPGWVQWRHGGQYVGWAPLPPEEIVVEYRDEPDVWAFVRESDFIVAPRLAAVILPVREYPVFLRETIVVNTAVPVSGFAVNPGIPPTVVAAEVGRPVPTFSVQPRVLAGTAQVPGAIQVHAQDLRGGTFRAQEVARQTQNVIRPGANVPQLRPLAAGGGGRLGDNPPRMARGAAPTTTTGQAPSQPQQPQGQRQQPSAQQSSQPQGLRQQPSAQQPTQQQGQRQPSAQPRQQMQQAQPPAQQHQQQGRTRPEPQTQGRSAAEQRQQLGPQPRAAQPQQRPNTEGRAGQPSRQPQAERRAIEQQRQSAPAEHRGAQQQERAMPGGRGAAEQGRPQPSAPRATEGRGPGPGAARQAAPPRSQPSSPATEGRGGGGPAQAAPQHGPGAGGAPRGGPPGGGGHAGPPGGARP
jgi:hypothetical protein